MEIISKIAELESYLPKIEQSKTKISKAGVGWHIYHSLKVINSVCSTLRKSNPDEYTTKFNWKKIYVMTLKSFPRGIGKAPKSTRPPDEIRVEDIHDEMSKARYLISQLKDLNKNAYFPHPVFGNMNLNPAIEFLSIHTNHHLKIIKDILK